MELRGYKKAVMQTKLEHIYNAEQFNELWSKLGTSSYLMQIFTERLKARSDSDTYTSLMEFNDPVFLK